MGGGGDQGGHTPYEAPETGQSKQLVRIVEIISEGEIGGLVDGMKSVYLDNTALQNTEGDFNFNNVELEGRVGTQDQDLLTGFESSEKEVSVGTEIKRATPITRTIIDSQVNRLRLTLGVRSLFSQNDEGDTNGATVNLVITVGDRTIPFTISGKYSSQYLKSIIIDNLPPTPFKVKVERATEDSKSQRLQNATIWASYTEIIDTQFAYPNTALIGVKFDSEYFNNIPNRTYEIYGIKVRVPTNYDPQRRTYTGLWDGTFKIAWTNNPAWVLYDLCTNKRYGLGARLEGFSVDKWALYQIAQYCDQLVPDGFGGTEPRFTCNLWLTEQRKAYDVLHDLCSVFRAMPVWNGQELTFIMDRPSDPVWTYTNANVENGEFEYSFSARKARHNAIQVEYIDASDSYQKRIEYVSDDEEIRKNELNLRKVSAFGCTSRGQAYRTGRWILETEKLEVKTVSFTVGREGLMHIPGDIIKVADCQYAGADIGGRVLAVNGRVVKVDRQVSLSGDNNFFSFINAQAQEKTLRIIRVSNGNELTLETEPVGIEKFSVWSLATQQIKAQLYRAISISEEEGKYRITALQHEPQKEAIVDNGAVFEPRQTTLLESGLKTIQNAEIQVNEAGISLSFEYFTNAEVNVKYQIKLYRTFKGEKAIYKIYDDLATTSLTFTGLPDGDYIAEIRAKNSAGQLSNPVSKTFSINFAISELVTVSKVFGIGLSWRNPLFANPNASIEIWVGRDNNFQHARKLVTLAYPTNSYSYDGLGVNERYFFWARMVDKTHSGEFTEAVEGVTEHSGEKLVGYLQGQITKSELAQGLASEITNMSEDLREEIKNRQGATSAISAQLQQEVQQRTQALQQEARERGTAISQLENADQEQAKQLATLTAKTNQAVAGIAEERSARTRENEANAQRFATLATQVGQANSNISRLEQAVNSANSATATRMTNLESRFNGDLTNLCLNPSMAENTHGWTNMERAQVDGQWVGVAKDRDCLYGNWLSVKPGDVFYCSAWVKNKNATQDLGIGLFITKDGNNHHWIRAAYISPEQARDWTKIEGYITVPADTNSAHMWFQIEKPWHSAGDCYLRDVIFTKSNNVSPALARVQSVGNTLSTLEGKVNATYTLKTEVMRNGKRAVAGIALGAGINANTAESQVIISAEKLAIADPNSATLTTPFIVANENGRSRVAINGNLITNGSITGAKIQANSHINAPHIQGGHIDIGNGQFVVDNQGRLTANQGIFRGRIEASDGYFNGIVRADKIEGDVLKMFTCELGGSVIIPSMPFNRRLTAIPFSMALVRGEDERAEGEVWVRCNDQNILYRKLICDRSSTREEAFLAFEKEISAHTVTTIAYDNQSRNYTYFWRNSKQWSNWKRNSALSPLGIVFFVTKI